MNFPPPLDLLEALEARLQSEFPVRRVIRHEDSAPAKQIEAREATRRALRGLLGSRVRKP